LAKCFTWIATRPTQIGKTNHLGVILLFTHYPQLDGARVLSINGEDPFVAVNTNAAIAGSYQALGTRQNGLVTCPFDP